MADLASDHTTTGADTRVYSLKQVVNAALASGLPVAVWRLPLGAATHACISFDKAFQVEHPELENSPFGFLFSPFVVGEQPSVFIKADITYSSGTGLLQFSDAVTQTQKQEFIVALESAETTNYSWHLNSSEAIHQQTEAGFKNAVTEAVKTIEGGQMEKVVLSRTAAKPLPADFNLVDAYSLMLEAYPRAFATLVSVPGTGTWMGASPEILVTIDPEKIFRTVALAGTQPAINGEPVGNAIWRQKEIEEQGMVERYVLSCFKKLRLREYTEVGPRTIVAGNLMHLRTDFSVDLKEVDFPTLGTDMLHLLHPTSAVCGLPKEPALNFILAHEGYGRSYYSGYLGPVNSPDGTHLYVNLRCMQLQKDQAILYAGAGITAESNAAKEWQETQHKMQTMLKILTKF
ncbi:chorismate-binding protein [Pontibacter burrus]|uniref:Chorismate-binding protein n=1 Tax=Pontibacter burrus TaxID=2704466 RepID=A0A6B3LVG0_9BACT|nr:chorismate-binding protein [Pontibacter burrus]NEM97550.1 chorismate-binding protein [Pontibacter burrus]